MLSIRDYKAILDAAPDGVLVVGSRGLILEANPKAAQLFGWTQAELVGRSVEELIPPTARERHVNHRERFGTQPHDRPMGAGLQLEGWRQDGSTFPVEVSLSPWIRDDDSATVICSIRDVSSVRRLQSFSDRALLASEEERLRIAQELHDDTAQRLAALILEVGAMARENDPEQRATLFDSVRGHLVEATDGVRRLARGLRPPELEELGLAHALAAYARSMHERGKFEVVLDVESADGLDDRRALAIYRILQEAISNARRHAGVDRVSLSLRRESGWLLAAIEDEGAGFDVGVSRHDQEGLGLLGMRERAAMIDARLTIDSAVGRGTTVRLQVPIPEQMTI
ncbi:MAG: PAS domain-containing sensor histidine kinase [Gemmatimonadota bacterium]